jgi:hypothetical protein
MHEPAALLHRVASSVRWGTHRSGRLRDALKLLCTYLRHEGVRSCRRPACSAVKHEIRKMTDRTGRGDAAMSGDAVMIRKNER